MQCYWNRPLLCITKSVLFHVETSTSGLDCRKLKGWNKFCSLCVTNFSLSSLWDDQTYLRAILEVGLQMSNKLSSFRFFSKSSSSKLSHSQAFTQRAVLNIEIASADSQAPSTLTTWSLPPHEFGHSFREIISRCNRSKINHKVTQQTKRPVVTVVQIDNCGRGRKHES